MASQGDIERNIDNEKVQDPVHVEPGLETLPAEKSDLDASQNPTSSPDIKSESDTRTKKQRISARLRYSTLCFTLFLGGWNDGATGALLPRIKSVYELNFILLSLVFVFSCAGFMSGSIANLFLTDHLGFGKTLVLGSALQSIGFAIQSPSPPYPVLVLGYFLTGMGFSIQDAQANGFVVNLKRKGGIKMSFIHACYALGLFLSPLVSTQFATLPRWSFHYLIGMGMALMNLGLLIFLFRFKSMDMCLRESGESPPAQSSPGSEAGESTFKQVMKSKEAHILAFFIVAHLGVGVTMGGWIVTFIIDVRGGGPDSGYIAAGVSGAIFLGRIILVPLNEIIGERNIIFFYSLLAIILELTVWFVPSLLGNAIAVCFIGFVFGPMFPIAVRQAGRIIPRDSDGGRMITGVVGWMAGFGQVGSALVPFMAGAIAQRFGLKTMPPLLFAMTIVMIVLWALVPTKPRHT